MCMWGVGGGIGGSICTKYRVWIENQGSWEQEGVFGIGPPYVSGHISQSESQHLWDKCLAPCPAALEVPQLRGNPS